MPMPEETSLKRDGVFHKVLPGETIFSIAQAYGISLEDIVQNNNIPNAAFIEENQLIFIPGATAPTLAAVKEPVNSGGNNFGWPIKGEILSFFKESSGNVVTKGIDIKCLPSSEIKASRAGRVVFADYLSGYDLTVIIDHLDGFHTVYSNSAELFVKTGEKVSKNEKIARMSMDNNFSHLHFEVRKGNNAQNPLYYLRY